MEIKVPEMKRMPKGRMMARRESIKIDQVPVVMERFLGSPGFIVNRNFYLVPLPLGFMMDQFG